MIAVKGSATQITLLLLLVFSPLAGITRVLCIGEDGHQEIEFVQGGTCQSDPCDQDTLAPEGLGFTSNEHCGSCVDIVLKAGAMLEQSRIGGLFAPVVFAQVDPYQRLFFAQLTTPLYAQPPPALVQPLRLLHSVRLLI